MLHRYLLTVYVRTLTKCPYHASSSLSGIWRWLWSRDAGVPDACLSSRHCWYSSEHQRVHSCAPFLQITRLKIKFDIKRLTNIYIASWQPVSKIILIKFHLLSKLLLTDELTIVNILGITILQQKMYACTLTLNYTQASEKTAHHLNQCYTSNVRQGFFHKF